MNYEEPDLQDKMPLNKSKVNRDIKILPDLPLENLKYVVIERTEWFIITYEAFKPIRSQNIIFFLLLYFYFIYLYMSEAGRPKKSIFKNPLFLAGATVSVLGISYMIYKKRNDYPIEIGQKIYNGLFFKVN